MSTERSTPHVVMLVPNDFTRDARAAKSASSLAEAGWRVTVIGSWRQGLPRTETIGNVSVLRVKIHKRTSQWHERPRKLGFKYVTDREAQAHAQHLRLATRDLSVRIARRQVSLSEQPRSRSRAFVLQPIRRVYLATTILLLRLTRRLVGLSARLRTPVKPRRRPKWGIPVYRDFEAAYGALIDKLRPNVIHAHNFPTMPIASRAASIGRAAGHGTRWVYDAHEYVEGITHVEPGIQETARAIERDYIHDADTTITVSDELADILQRDHGLRYRPPVVLNAPSKTMAGGLRQTVRSASGVARDVPLVVYSGNINPHRGIHTLVEALPLVPTAHLAIATDPRSATGNVYKGELIELATRLDCAERLHWVPFVDPSEVTAYLADADVGVSPLTRYGNAEVALTNKLFEYMQAGLPVVVSDCAAQANFVRRLGIGEVHIAQDAESLATALVAVLRSPSDYTAGLTPDTLSRFSWEAQEKVLSEVYASLIPSPSG